MRRHSKVYITILLLAIIGLQPGQLILAVQEPTKAPGDNKAKSKETKPGDYSQEAFVIEKIKTAYHYESDGTGTRDLNVRVKIQSDAGVQAFGELPFPYSSANEKIHIDFVRVLKKDGSTINAPESSVKEMEAPVSKTAPVYSDLKIKVVTVPGLRPGDTLEFHAVSQIFSALAPNQFWIEHNLVNESIIVLDEQLEVNIPATSVVKMKSETRPATREESGRRIYTWKYANLVRLNKDEDDEKPVSARMKEIEEAQKTPEIQMSTFKSWDDVGKWYGDLQRDRIIPDEKIKAKVAELTKDRKTDLEKIEALYSFVAKNFRYVSLSFGEGHFQPHAAAEIFANQYGDCKDKHTLLASMLAVAGIQAYPVLINSYRKLDSEVPSPAQFNHVITAIPMGKELVWLDTTPEVAPFRLLSPGLRKKQALYIPENAEARLETTPADPPFPTSLIVEIDAKADEKGELTGHTHVKVRGDNEISMRSRFRVTPPSEWDGMTYVLHAELDLGYGAHITDIKPSDPNDTEKPFEIDYNFKTTHYGPFPLPVLRLPDPQTDNADKQDEQEAIEIGLPSEIIYRIKLVLPSGDTKKPKLPRPIALDRDYAEYRSSYTIEGNTIIGERVLHVRQRQIAVASNQDYQAFHKSVLEDEAQWLSLDNGKTAAKVDKDSIPVSMKTEDLIKAANTAVKDENFELAEALLKRAVNLEPQHKTAYGKLGKVLLRESKYDGAVEALREQTKLNPFDGSAFGDLAQALQAQEKYTEAEAAFRKQIQLSPLNSSAHGKLGRMLVDIKKYKEAVTELELVVSSDGDDEGQDQLSLARAYLNLGQKEKAAEAFEKAAESGDSEELYNDVAYYMAVGGFNLDKAQEYAESAVLDAESNLLSTSVKHLENANLGDVGQLASDWDTLGWVFYKKGDLDSAEKYIKSAWQLEQHSLIAVHLGEISEKRSQKDEAIHWYALANAATHPEPEAKENLARLVAKDRKDALIATAKNELVEMRTFKLGELLKSGKEKAEANFYIMFVPTPSLTAKVAAVKFIGGSEQLKPFESALKNIPWKISFPDDTSTKIVFNGKLICEAGSHGCSVEISSVRESKPSSLTVSLKKTPGKPDNY